MPGKVIEGHAKIESDCKACHAKFDKAAQQSLCMDCHKDVGLDVKFHTGYHGRLDKTDCRLCHTDHKGRDMNIVVFDEKKFDHRLTDFELKGAHAKPGVQCQDCHKPKEKYRDAPSACVACHKKDDVHKGSLGKDCASCHTDRDWKVTRFDHSKTRFPLIGKHLDVECTACHKDPNYKITPSACIACHRKDDKHKAHFGDKCESCHTAKDWKHITFDHDRDTKYPLRGKHMGVKCAACHKGVLYKDKTDTFCFACHEKDDKHKGQQGKNCGDCHNERSWVTTRFDHGQTRFPLLGKHATVECKKCHLSAQFKDAKTECVACHKKDDSHKRRLGSQCEDCHNARDWKAWDYDHDTRTRFKLDGAHKGLACQACHVKPVDGKPSLVGTCQSCHDVDDVHDGNFGKTCERCHVTSSFKKVRMGAPKGR